MRTLAFLLLALAAVPALGAGRDTLYQLSTISALKAGDYNPRCPYGEVKAHGDFGIGTFEGLDGEMIELDGRVYRVGADSTIAERDDSTPSPFATVTFFEPDLTINVDKPVTLDQLKQIIDSALPDTNVAWAVKIHGDFDYVKTRSPPGQAKPYPVLDEVLKHQSVFEHTNVTGTAVGFRMPPPFEAVVVNGYHLHFLSDAHDAGGHLLDARVKNAVVTLDETPEVEVDLKK